MPNKIENNSDKQGNSNNIFVVNPKRLFITRERRNECYWRVIRDDWKKKKSVTSKNNISIIIFVNIFTLSWPENGNHKVIVNYLTQKSQRMSLSLFWEWATRSFSCFVSLKALQGKYNYTLLSVQLCSAWPGKPPPICHKWVSIPHMSQGVCGRNTGTAI